VEREVLRVREASNEVWGGRKIRRAMQRQGRVVVPAASTITAILRRHGRLEGRVATHPGPYQRFERAAPNELWQMDFKGHFALLVGRCHPLTVLDDHARYSLELGACGDEQDGTVRTRLVPTFRRYGLPWAMLIDNGAPWGDEGDQPFTIFTVWLMRVGIRISHSRPRHPQTLGKDERFHRTLKAELLQGANFRDLADCQRAFDAWRHVYNFERPHDGLGGAVPGERYRPSPRPFPEVLPAIEYAPGDHVRKVDAKGCLSFHNRVFRLSKAFRGQPVALRPTRQDGLFSVHYCVQQIGLLDLSQLAPRIERACGYVDNADALPPSPQAPTTAPKGIKT
jgi:transposase InsO family protein